MRRGMKTGLFILSLMGVAISSFALSKELNEKFSLSHTIYVALLATLACKSLVGVIITFPQGKKRLKLFRGNYKKIKVL
jgi:cyanate permease